MGTSGLENPIIGEVSRVFHALGDRSRLKLLRTLLDCKRPIRQGALATASGLSQANTSKHLAVLVDAGLVTREKKGFVVYFKPHVPFPEKVCDLVCHFVSARIRSAYCALN